MSRRSWIVAVVVAVLAVTVVGPWLYINVIRDDPPERLTLDDATSTTSTTRSPTDGATTTAPGSASIDDVAGAWSVGTGSQVGYRVKEVLFGQDAEAVGRTTEVTGTLQIEGTTVTATEVEVDMASVTSDEGRRDGQFRGRIMDVATYPTATFTLTEPIELGGLPADGEQASYPITGDLTLRGVTRSVTFELTARRNGATIAANGVIDVDFDDFEIPDASGGPAQVGRDGELELLLVFERV